MPRFTLVAVFFISALVLDRAAAVPISNRDRAAIQVEVLEDLLERVAEEMQVRAIERDIMERTLETEEIPQVAPAKRDSNEKRNLSRLAQMGARGFGRRRR